jgi:hypothetical protein
MGLLRQQTRPLKAILKKQNGYEKNILMIKRKRNEDL